jgi:hypothetical protein
VNCRDAARLIDYFFDGELDGHVMRDAALHITRCPSCEGELHDRERAQGLLTESINRELDQIDLSVIWTAIDRELASSRTERNGLRLAVPEGAGSETWPAAEQWSDSSVPAAGPLGRRWSPVGASLTFGGLVALAASIVVAVTMLGHGPKPEQTVSVATAPHTSANQVRIESMDYPGSSVAMWSEPEDDTMVIWIEDDEPAPAASVPVGNPASTPPGAMPGTIR